MPIAGIKTKIRETKEKALKAKLIS